MTRASQQSSYWPLPSARCTGGYFSSLSNLICQAAQEAIETGSQAVTRDLLDPINTSRSGIP